MQRTDASGSFGIYIEVQTDRGTHSIEFDRGEASATAAELPSRNCVQPGDVDPRSVPAGEPGLWWNLDMSRGWPGGAGHLGDRDRAEASDQGVGGEDHGRPRANRRGELDVPHVSPQWGHCSLSRSAIAVAATCSPMAVTSLSGAVAPR
jgi:hypothetical protein